MAMGMGMGMAIITMDTITTTDIITIVMAAGGELASGSVWGLVYWATA
jgi:hypothetical protein